jgi:hypothetical protein
MAGDYLYILQGDSYTFSTNVAVSGVGTDLSGATIWFLAKDDPAGADSDAIINASTTSGQIGVSGANNNVVTVTLNSATTYNYAESNSLYWSLKARTSGGFVYTLDRGRAAVRRPIVVSIS